MNPTPLPLRFEPETKGIKGGIFDARGRLVATMENRPYTKRTNKDGALFAASPGLLAALRAFVTDTEAELNGYMAKELRQYTRERLVKDALKAIAEAEGVAR